MSIVNRAEFLKRIRGANEHADDVVIRKQFSTEAAVDAEARTVTATITTGDVDRENDVIDSAGWDLKDFLRSPVILWAHDRKQPPIAQAIDVTPVEGGLRSTAQFPEKGIYPFADMVFDLIKGGFIRATSVGFQPLEWSLDEERGGVNFQRQSLYEWSWVPVPANQNALIAASASGVELEQLRHWVGDVIAAWPGDLPLAGKAWEKLVAERDAEKEEPAEGIVKRDPVNVGTLEAILRLDSGDFEEKLNGVEEQLDRLATKANGLTVAVTLDGKAVAENTVRHMPAVLAEIERQGDIRVGDLEESEGVTAAAMATFSQLEEQISDLGAVAARFNAIEIPDGVLREDVTRWNKQLPEAFDINAESFPPRSIEQEMAAKYCECEIKVLRQQGENVASVRMGAFLLAIREELASVSVDDIRNLNSDGEEAAPQHETIQLNSRRSDTFLINGMRFVDLGETKMTLRLTPSWYGLRVTSYAKSDAADSAAEFMGRVEARAAQMKLLKGEAFSLSGAFLEREGETFDDVFLTDVNETALKRAVKLINDKGAGLENRGLLLLGPPGTGKTLSGRIMMNEAKATFIWMSARDFYYGGGFRSLDSAFKLARENAPAILFIEDVDSYLTENVTDLLKSTMDGLATTSGVVTILTSNYPERLPKAIIDRPGRFHDVLRLDLPDEVVRSEMLAKWLPDLTGDALKQVVESLSGYSGAHVREFARFVGVIREQDELDIEAAATEALAKIQEQRDLITSVQTQGSHYCAPSYVLAKDEPGDEEIETKQLPAGVSTTEIKTDGEGQTFEGGALVVVDISAPEPKEIVLEILEEEEEKGSTIELDIADLEKAVDNGIGRALSRRVGHETGKALRYLSGRV